MPKMYNICIELDEIMEKGHKICALKEWFKEKGIDELVTQFHEATITFGSFTHQRAEELKGHIVHYFNFTTSELKEINDQPDLSLELNTSNERERSIYISPLLVDAADLRRRMEYFGEVEHFITNESKRYAIVEFKEKEAAKSIIRDMPRIYVNGRVINISPSKPMDTLITIIVKYIPKFFVDINFEHTMKIIGASSWHIVESRHPAFNFLKVRFEDENLAKAALGQSFEIQGRVFHLNKEILCYNCKNIFACVCRDQKSILSNESIQAKNGEKEAPRYELIPKSNDNLSLKKMAALENEIDALKNANSDIATQLNQIILFMGKIQTHLNLDHATAESYTKLPKRQSVKYDSDMEYRMDIEKPSI